MQKIFCVKIVSVVFRINEILKNTVGYVALEYITVVLYWLASKISFLSHFLYSCKTLSEFWIIRI